MDVSAVGTSGLWKVMSVSTFSTSDHWESLIAVPRGRGAVGCSGNALGVHWLCCGYAGATLGNVTMGSFMLGLFQGPANSSADSIPDPHFLSVPQRRARFSGSGLRGERGYRGERRENEHDCWEKTVTEGRAMQADHKQYSYR